MIERKLVTDHQWLFPWKNAFVISHSGKRVQHKTGYPVTLLLTDLLHLQGNSGPVLGWTRYTSYQGSAYTQTYCMQCLPVITSYFDDDHHFYIVLFHALEQTHCVFVTSHYKSDYQQKVDPGERKKIPCHFYQDSNLWPSNHKPSALPTELSPFPEATGKNSCSDLQLPNALLHPLPKAHSSSMIQLLTVLVPGTRH